jgi:hypothetical protein
MEINHMSAGRSGKRRQQKKARFLSAVACEKQERFCIEWNKRLVSWLYEINRRGAEFCKTEDVSVACERVFEVVEKVEELLAECDDEARQIVEAETRRVLTNECCKVVARVYGAELYKVVNPRYPRPRI